MAYKTKQKELILEFLKSHSENHLKAEDIVIGLQNHVGIATVYRNLDKLVLDGVVRKYIAEEGKSACYQYMSTSVPCKEHYHLKCDICGELFHIECDYLSELIHHVKKEHSFEINGLKTIYYGKCGRCK